MGVVDKLILKADRISPIRRIGILRSIILVFTVGGYGGPRDLWSSFDTMVIIDQGFGHDFCLGVTYPIEIDRICGNKVLQ